MTTTAETATKPLWLAMEGMIRDLTDQDLADGSREASVKRVAAALDEAGYNVAGHAGHLLELRAIDVDCDRDTLLVQARPHGPTCHLQRCSCFAHAPRNFLAELDALVEQRERERPPGSYTTLLLDGGVRGIAQKVGEEGVETALAAVVQDDTALAGEAADLLFHLQVLLRARGMSLEAAVAVLRQRHEQPIPPG